MSLEGKILEVKYEPEWPYVAIEVTDVWLLEDELSKSSIINDLRFMLMMNGLEGKKGE